MPLSNILYIELTFSKRAKVSASDFAALSKFSWRAAKSAHCWYAVRRIKLGEKTRTIKMHRQIACTPFDQICHHKNGQSLDNRRENLENMYPLEHKMHHQLYRISKKT